MKVISIQQPWASLVVLGHKMIETRSWDTKHRGPILIHASMGTVYKRIPPEDPFWREYHNLFAFENMAPIEQLPYGCILGKVELISTIKTDTTNVINCTGVTHKSGRKWDFSKKEMAFGDYSPGRHGWLLDNPVVFAEPIPARGQLGLWNYPMCKICGSWANEDLCSHCENIPVQSTMYSLSK